MQNDDLMTVGETAEYLRLKPMTVYKLKSQGKLPFCKLGGKLFFRKSRIDTFLDKQSVDAKQAG